MFGFLNKLDVNIKPYINITSRNKIPIIISYKGDSKKVKQKILSCNGKIKYEYSCINAISCYLTSTAIDRLTEIPETLSFMLDYKACLCMQNSERALGMHHARNFNLTGKGIGIGIIDSGVYPHPDFYKKRDPIAHFSDLLNGYLKPYDDNGHGTFICGCLASSGLYQGVCVDSSICLIKAFDSTGRGYVSDIIKGLEILCDYKEKYNIRIILLPFEIPYVIKLNVNPLKNAIDYIISKGISIVTPSGNLGNQASSINCPGNIKDVITVSGAQCLDPPFRIANFSGHGPTLEGLNKPDLCAPSVNITSLGCNMNYIPIKKGISEPRALYVSMSGTSIAAAFIAGVCSLILEKTPELTPSDLKSVLMLSTTSLGENKNSQGTGLFIFEKLLK